MGYFKRVIRSVEVLDELCRDQTSLHKLLRVSFLASPPESDLETSSGKEDYGFSASYRLGVSNFEVTINDIDRVKSYLLGKHSSVLSERLEQMPAFLQDEDRGSRLIAAWRLSNCI